MIFATDLANPEGPVLLPDGSWALVARSAKPGLPPWPPTPPMGRLTTIPDPRRNRIETPAGGGGASAAKRRGGRPAPPSSGGSPAAA